MTLDILPQQTAEVLAWIDEHKDEAIADLQRFCRQPSVATQNRGMAEMARIVADSLAALEAEVTVVPTAGYPVVVGRLSGERGPRLAIYNHYDVQPPEPLELWDSPPFDAAIRDGALYARGVADNKGNVAARIWAARAWLEVHGSLPGPVTFVVEGEEEIASPHLAEFAANNRHLLGDLDACLWEAGYRDPSGALSMYAGLKGMLYVELRVRGVSRDLHSSNATLAPNAAWRLVEAMSALRDSRGRVTIPGFYDAVRPPTAYERELISGAPLDPAALKALWGVDHLLGEDENTGAVDLTIKSLYTPTCNIAGLWSGYTGEGTKTVLPAEAAAKIDFRLVPDQDPVAILASLRAHLAASGFPDVEVVEMEAPEWPAQSPVDSPLMQSMARTARLVYGIEPRVMPRMAATGPMEQLCQRYGLVTAGGVGVGHADSRNHSPNENVRLDDFVLGIKHVAALLADFASS